jgi:4'-phosphopantetheinyl transferase
MKIYAINEDMDNCKYDIEKFFQYLSVECVNKIKRFKKREDKLRSAISELGIRFIANHIYDIKREDISFEKTLYGKPFIKNMENFHFNISHSENWVVFAIDQQPIGIDIEKIQCIDLEVANLCLSCSELRILSSKTYEEGLQYFYELWTLKESYVKATGEGLNKDMKEVAFNLDNHWPLLVNPTLGGEFYFNRYNLDTNYKLAVSSKNNIFPTEIEKLSLKCIIKFFSDSM